MATLKVLYRSFPWRDLGKPEISEVRVAGLEVQIGPETF
jgi:hypothetical protein